MLRRRAFTLIELLVVIAIIAILAAILFPVFAQAKASAKKAARLSDMKQYAIAFKIYAADFDDVTPRAWLDCDDGDCATRATHWPQRVFPYIKNNDLMIDREGPRVFPRDMTSRLNFASGPNTAINWHIGDGVPETAAERVSELIILAETGVRDWFGNGTLIRAASSMNPFDWRDIWPSMPVSDGARRSIRCVQYNKLGNAWMMNHYDPQIPWSTDFRHQEGMNVPRMDGSARYHKMGTFRPENFYLGAIPAYANDGRNNCDL